MHNKLIPPNRCVFVPQKLKCIVESEGERWDVIAGHFPDRSELQCQQRWTKVLNPELVKGPWTKEVSSLGSSEVMTSWVWTRGMQWQGILTTASPSYISPYYLGILTTASPSYISPGYLGILTTASPSYISPCYLGILTTASPSYISPCYLQQNSAAVKIELPDSKNFGSKRRHLPHYKVARRWRYCLNSIAVYDDYATKIFSYLNAMFSGEYEC